MIDRFARLKLFKRLNRMDRDQISSKEHTFLLVETLTNLGLSFLFAEELIYSIQSGSKTAGTKRAIPDKTVKRLYGT